MGFPGRRSTRPPILEDREPYTAEEVALPENWSTLSPMERYRTITAHCRKSWHAAHGSHDGLSRKRKLWWRQMAMTAADDRTGAAFRSLARFERAYAAMAAECDAEVPTHTEYDDARDGMSFADALRRNAMEDDRRKRGLSDGDIVEIVGCIRLTRGEQGGRELEDDTEWAARRQGKGRMQASGQPPA